MAPPFRPICFVVMPFGVRETAAAPPAPARVNFDLLWEQALQPALEDLGYRTLRADQDVGTLIINEMLERLYYSDLVIADISIPNANAYYEVGVRHAARHDGCVLIAASWARPVFDLAQIRRIDYDHPHEAVDADAAQKIIATLRDQVARHRHAATPFHSVVPGYRAPQPDEARARELANYLEAFEELRAQIAQVADLDAAYRPDRAAAILREHPAAATDSASVAVEIVRLLRDRIGRWDLTRDYIEALPARLRELPYLQEQLALALSRQGDDLQAIAALKRLIALRGDSAERQGLIGGRYKRLYRAAANAGDGLQARRFLDLAIRHYENGMRLDLNNYFPSCNLPLLYRRRGEPGDEALALAAAT
uniref:tetratricopeptide repeat-containing protein n=1 Tax=Tahibacter caeni TaxID=1453545 RepID=UPI002148D5AA